MKFEGVTRPWSVLTVSRLMLNVISRSYFFFLMACSFRRSIRHRFFLARISWCLLLIGGNSSIACNVFHSEAERAANFNLVLFESRNHFAGEVFELKDTLGTPVVLNFWFPSCPPCAAEMPDFEVAFQKYQKQVEFVGIQLLGLDTKEDGQKFISNLEVSYIVGPDEGGAIMSKYGIFVFPTTVFIDRNGYIVKRWEGTLDTVDIEEILRSLLD